MTQNQNGNERPAPAEKQTSLVRRFFKDLATGVVLMLAVGAVFVVRDLWRAFEQTMKGKK